MPRASPWLALAFAAAIVPALAAEPPTPPRPAPIRAMETAIEQLSIAAELMLGDFVRQIAAQKARIAELEKRCADRCSAPLSTPPDSPATKGE